MIGHAGAGRLTGQIECLLNRRKVQRCQFLSHKNRAIDVGNGLPDGHIGPGMRRRNMTFRCWLRPVIGLYEAIFSYALDCLDIRHDSYVALPYRMLEK